LGFDFGQAQVASVVGQLRALVFGGGSSERFASVMLLIEGIALLIQLSIEFRRLDYAREY